MHIHRESQKNGDIHWYIDNWHIQIIVLLGGELDIGLSVSPVCYTNMSMEVPFSWPISVHRRITGACYLACYGAMVSIVFIALWFLN
jgi:hypothetical protein